MDGVERFFKDHNITVVGERDITTSASSIEPASSVPEEGGCEILYVVEYGDIPFKSEKYSGFFSVFLHKGLEYYRPACYREAVVDYTHVLQIDTTFWRLPEFPPLRYYLERLACQMHLHFHARQTVAIHESDDPEDTVLGYSLWFAIVGKDRFPEHGKLVETISKSATNIISGPKVEKVMDLNSEFTFIATGASWLKDHVKQIALEHPLVADFLPDSDSGVFPGFKQR